VREYLIREEQRVEADTPIITVENYWAIMTLKAVGPGIFRKSFFDHHETVKIGDPVGIVATDGDDLIYDRDNLTVEIIEIKRTRPNVMEVVEQVMRENREVLRRLAE
jgi:pyruvate/2-oxoglutarate dehydrogenase complex dihydrolipoamide acyltransferase (E2) component